MTNVARLPGPIADVWDWQRLGLCRGRDSTQFFHPDGERGASRGRREAAAKNVCQGCPVRAECAAQALATREPYGVWGGFTEAERLRLLAIGWEDCADRRGARVDIARLEARLGLRPTATPSPVNGLRQRLPSAPRTAAATAPKPTHPQVPPQRRVGATRARVAR
jgi:WhiB family transcriptional regulator, redox-sensing transcriptional regulator